jgi:WD40 repeat protein
MDAVITKKIFLFFCVLCTGRFLHGLSVGSDTTVSREAYSEFPELDTDNEMKGFAAFENGFLLENLRTTCTFDSFFPVSGPVNLNGGTLRLNKDLAFDFLATVSGMGSVVGNGYSISFPDTLTTLTVEAVATVARLDEIDSVAPNDTVYSVDWSYDDDVVAGGVNSDILYTYSFDGTALTYLAEIDAGWQINTVKAHPSAYYFAVGTGRQPGLAHELYVYKLVAGVLSLADSYEINEEVSAVSWSVDGSYLLVTHGDEVEVFSFSSETLTPIDALDFGIDTARNDSATWNQTSDYFAIGTSNALRIFYFDGATITSTYELATGGPDVESVDWSKTGSFIACGLSAPVTNEIRVYEFNISDGTLTERATVDRGETVYAVHWNSNVTKLVIGTNVDPSNPEVDVYTFAQSPYSLTFEVGYELSTIVYDTRWSHDDMYVLTGDAANNITVFEHTSAGQVEPFESIDLRDVSLILHSDIWWYLPVKFYGECAIHGNGHELRFAGDGFMTVTGGGSLTMDNVHLDEATTENFRNYSDDESITFIDSRFHLDGEYTFSYGSLLFERNSAFYNPGKFIYASRMSSTISSDSSLTLERGVTFSYDPSIASKDLLVFEGPNSALVLEAATFAVTSTGITLKKGELSINNNSYLSCASGGEITFGTETIAEDLNVVFSEGTRLQLQQGSFGYKNVSSDSWNMPDEFSFLRIEPSARLRLYQSLDPGEGVTSFGAGAYLALASGKTLDGTIAADADINYETIP